ncbi:TPA: TrlF family AAA-like ATPase [Vibrio parahaemolyticus]|uniref:TrlF family AAA-like ATPase n=3 Tax=Vibrio parahaemolyticus TaxID=670 RepID=UPI000402995F|nr:ATPase [Vibrio parahaemolyticus]KIT46471.1 ATPase [Vibrio parahaemolyticus EN9701121]EGQ7914087.1 ATPase [Vibrio parahaemolyticus]EGQ9863096.1 ATPase [Vibrio parahaemolyticus]EGW0142879.1 ATPase [Vibrio parahaemolyticus]EHB9909277.1 ATPase [Vibrio parahaemolyticus]
MSRFKHGSEWRRWDLHVHTPDSVLESQFKSDWDGYLDVIESKGDQVSVIGVTDYYTISGYEKMLKYKADGRLQNIDALFPNIEFRITPETQSNKGINIHVIVDPSDEEHVRKINEALARLTYKYDEVKYGCVESQLIDLGRALKSGLSNEAALKEGMKNFKPSYDSFRSWYEEESWLKKNSVIVVANASKDGVSGIRENGFMATRKDIYKFTDMIFSGKDNDIKHFMGGDERTKADILSDYGRIIPCVNGSDAHEFGKMFEPSLRRNCWIKADPTFSGLRQVIYEPERVKIQELSPEDKSEYQTIRRVRYIDSSGEKLFNDEWIPLSKDLNTVIGGKSSGKSMLLYHIAKTINSSEVKNSVIKAKSATYDDLSSVDFEVEWSNGERSKLSQSESADDKAITFIPQLYINQLADKDGKDDLNKLISKVLNQNDEYKSFVDDTNGKINVLRTQISDKIDKRFELLEQHLKLKEESQQIGNSKSVQQEIDRIKDNAEQLRKKSNFSKDDEDRYNKLVRTRSSIQRAKAKLESFQSHFNDILTNVEDSRARWIETIQSEIAIKSGFSEKSSVLSELSDILREELSKAFDSFIVKTRDKQLSIPERLREVEQKLAAVSESLVPLESKVQDKAALDNLNKQLKAEELKLKQINEKDNARKIVDENGISCRAEIDSLYKDLFSHYQQLSDKVSEYQVDEDIQIKAKLSVNTEKFDLFTQCFNRTGNVKYLLNTLVDDQGKYQFNLNTVCEDISSVSGRITTKEAPALRKHATQLDAFKHLYADCFEVDYVVSYKDDDIVQMSPGKRGLVLLSLMLELSNSTHPILIDQPEDNLDNRTIYSELKDFVRKCKHKRQIIMVTHNANLVVAADAECVIVADQKGQQDDSNGCSEFKFDYFGGSLELSYDSPLGETYNQLSDMGIRQHVCHILEGGIAAFKEREQKYNLL